MILIKLIKKYIKILYIIFLLKINLFIFIYYIVHTATIDNLLIYLDKQVVCTLLFLHKMFILMSAGAA